MRKTIRYAVVVLLLLLSLTAMLGGWALMDDPGGGNLGISVDLLADTPWQDYQIPGLVLLLLFGIFSLVIALATLFAVRWHGVLVLLQGLALAVWLGAEMYYGIILAWIQYPYFILAILLIILGYYLQRKDNDIDR